MAADSSDLNERLVAGFERGGRRRRFDPQAKRELVQACLQPGVSVARIALEHKLNANLLRKSRRCNPFVPPEIIWIGNDCAHFYQRRDRISGSAARRRMASTPSSK